MKVVTFLESAFLGFREFYPNLEESAGRVFLSILDSIGTKPDSFSEDERVVLNYLYAIFALFHCPFSDRDDKNLSGWEVLQRSKQLQIPLDTKKKMNQFAKGKMKVYRVKNNNIFRQEFTVREVKLTKRLDSLPVEISVPASILQKYRENDLFLAFVHELKNRTNFLFIFPLERDYLLASIEQYLEWPAKEEKNKNQKSDLYKMLSSVTVLLKASLLTVSECGLNLSKYESDLYGRIREERSLFSEPLLESEKYIVDSGMNGFGVIEIEIKNFSKLIKVFNKAKNIESFGDYSHVFMSDEEDPRVLANFQISEDKNILLLDPLVDGCEDAILEFLEIKAKDYLGQVNVPLARIENTRDWDHSSFQDLTSANDVGGYLDKINKRKDDLLGLGLVEFVYPFINYISRNPDTIEGIWDEFAGDDPKRGETYEAGLYAAHFFEYLLSDAKMRKGNKVLSIGEEIMDIVRQVVPDGFEMLFRNIMDSGYFLFSVEGYDDRTKELIVCDLCTNQLSTVHYIEESEILLEDGAIYVGRKVLWQGRNILTHFTLSYPKSYQSRLKKLLFPKQKSSLFEDLEQHNLGIALMQLHLDSKNRNLINYPFQ